MFYQVQAGKKFFSRFLQREDSDISKVVVDQEICAYGFSAVSSPSCNSYAVRETA